MSDRAIIYVVMSVALLAIAVAVNLTGAVAVFFNDGFGGGRQLIVFGWPFVMCGVMSEYQFVNGNSADIFGSPHHTPDFRFTTTLFEHPHLSSYIAVIPAAFNLAWWCACGGLVFSLAGRWNWEQGSRLPRYSLAHLILIQALIAAAVAGHFSLR